MQDDDGYYLIFCYTKVGKYTGPPILKVNMKSTWNHKQKNMCTKLDFPERSCHCRTGTKNKQIWLVLLHLKNVLEAEYICPVREFLSFVSPIPNHVISPVPSKDSKSCRQKTGKKYLPFHTSDFGNPNKNIKHSVVTTLNVSRVFTVLTPPTPFRELCFHVFFGSRFGSSLCCFWKCELCPNPKVLPFLGWRKWKMSSVKQTLMTFHSTRLFNRDPYNGWLSLLNIYTLSIYIIPT